METTPSEPPAAVAATHRRRWNQKEKDAAAEGVRRFGAFNHRRIAQLVGTLSRAQVRTYLYAAGYRKLGAAPFYTTVEPPPPPPPPSPPPATAERNSSEVQDAALVRVVDAVSSGDAVLAQSARDEAECAHLAPGDKHVPFWSAAELAADGWTPPQRKAFDRAFSRQLAARAAAAEITSVDIVHGHGTVARRLLLRGEFLVDPCAAYVEAPANETDRVVAYNDAHFRLRTDTRAAPSYYLNEARDRQPNVEWRVVDLGRPALGFVVLRDIQPKEELLLFYEAPD